MARPSRPGSPRCACLLIGALVLAGACTTTRPAGRDGADPAAPPTPSRYRVSISGLTQVGPYLDVHLAGKDVDQRGEARRFFFPASPVCRSALTSEGEAQYRAIGSFGKLKGGDGSVCQPVGLGSLRAWRDAGGTLRKQPLPPRDRAEFTPYGAGEQLLLARGRFPVSLELGWPQPMDAVAMLPVEPACEAAIAHGVATIEFQATGQDVLVLEVDEGRCPILGLAVPVDPDVSP